MSLKQWLFKTVNEGRNKEIIDRFKNDIKKTIVNYLYDEYNQPGSLSETAFKSIQEKNNGYSFSINEERAEQNCKTLHDINDNFSYKILKELKYNDLPEWQMDATNRKIDFNKTEIMYATVGASVILKDIANNLDIEHDKNINMKDIYEIGKKIAKDIDDKEAIKSFNDRIKELDKKREIEVNEKGESINMKEKDLILEYLTNQISKNEVGYTTIPNFVMRDKLNLEKDDFDKAFVELLKDKKVFYHKEQVLSVTEDGKKEMLPKIRYFIDSNDFEQFKYKKELQKDEYKAKQQERQQEKDLIIPTLSENAQKLYSVVNKELGEDIAYKNSYELKKDSGIDDFNDFIEAKGELLKNKLLYETKLKFKEDPAYVMMNDPRVLNCVLEKNKQFEKRAKEKSYTPKEVKKDIEM